MKNVYFNGKNLILYENKAFNKTKVKRRYAKI